MMSIAPAAPEGNDESGEVELEMTTSGGVEASAEGVRPTVGTRLVIE